MREAWMKTCGSLTEGMGKSSFTGPRCSRHAQKTSTQLVVRCLRRREARCMITTVQVVPEWLCRVEAAKLSKVVATLQRAERAAALQRTRDSLADRRKGLGQAYKKLRAPLARPLGFLRGNDGRVTSHPGELDAILRTAWHSIYEGNSPDHPLLVAKFLQSHRQHLFCRYILHSVR